MNNAIIVLLLLLGLGFGAYLLLQEPEEVPIEEVDSSQSDKQAPKTTSPKKSDKPKAPAQPIATSRYEGKGDDEQVVGKLPSESKIRAKGSVIGPDGSPVENALVQLMIDTSQVRGRAQEGALVAKVRTRASGRFAFEGLETGRNYMVKAKHENFTTKTRFPITVTDVKSLTINLQLEAGLGFHGQVFDSAGGPLSGVKIEVIDLSTTGAGGSVVVERETLTKEDGTYEVKHLNPGMKRVFARKEGYSSDGHNGLNLRDGQSLKYNFHLGAGFTMSGIVRDERSGAPIEGATIIARPVSSLAAQRSSRTEPSDRGLRGTRPPVRPRTTDVGEHQEKRNDPPRRRANALHKNFLREMARTDASGRFQLNGLMEARYILQVTARGFQANNGAPADAGANDLDIKLVRSARIIGRVVDDLSGEAVTNFTIATSSMETPLFIPDHLKQRFTQREEGDFEYLDVSPGKHFIQAEAPGYAGGRAEPVTVAADQEVTGIVVRLVRGATIRGVVVTSAGQPAERATIRLQPKAESANPNSPNEQAAMFRRILSGQMRMTNTPTAITDKTGAFTLKNVLGGRYVVEVSHPEFVDGESQPFTTEDTGEVDVGSITVKMGGTLQGKVLRKDDGKPDTKATVMITHIDPTKGISRSLPTNSKGEFVVRGLEAGEYRIVAVQRDGQYQLSALLLAGTQPQTVVSVVEGKTVIHDL